MLFVFTSLPKHQCAAFDEVVVVGLSSVGLFLLRLSTGSSVVLQFLWRQRLVADMLFAFSTFRWSCVATLVVVAWPSIEQLLV